MDTRLRISGPLPQLLWIPPVTSRHVLWKQLRPWWPAQPGQPSLFSTRPSTRVGARLPLFPRMPGSHRAGSFNYIVVVNWVMPMPVCLCASACACRLRSEGRARVPRRTVRAFRIPPDPIRLQVVVASLKHVGLGLGCQPLMCQVSNSRKPCFEEIRVWLGVALETVAVEVADAMLLDVSTLAACSGTPTCTRRTPSAASYPLRQLVNRFPGSAGPSWSATKVKACRGKAAVNHRSPLSEVITTGVRNGLVSRILWNWEHH